MLFFLAVSLAFSGPVLAEGMASEDCPMSMMDCCDPGDMLMMHDMQQHNADMNEPYQDECSASDCSMMSSGSNVLFQSGNFQVSQINGSVDQIGFIVNRLHSRTPSVLKQPPRI